MLSVMERCFKCFSPIPIFRTTLMCSRPIGRPRVESGYIVSNTGCSLIPGTSSPFQQLTAMKTSSNHLIFSIGPLQN